MSTCLLLYSIIFKNVDSDPIYWFHSPLIGYDLQFEKYWLGLSDKEDEVWGNWRSLRSFSTFFSISSWENQAAVYWDVEDCGESILGVDHQSGLQIKNLKCLFDIG